MGKCFDVQVEDSYRLSLSCRRENEEKAGAG